jgi:hypothetical protein
MRLIVPFIFAVFTILMPRLYFAQDYQVFCKLEDANGNMYEEHNYFKYFIGMLPHVYTKLSWLWFLPALFIDSCINYPLVAWTQRRQRNIPIGKDDIQYIVGLIVALVIWGIPNYLGAGGDDTLLPMVFTVGVFFVFHFSVQLLLKLENGYKYSLWIKAVGPLASCALNYYRDGTNVDTIYGFLATLNYDLMFMAQGVVDQFYMKEILQRRAEIAKTLYAAFILITFSIVVSLTSPTVSKNEGDFYSYPLYEPTWLQCTYTLGSYWWVYLLGWWCQEVSNEKYDDWWYKFLNDCSMWGYLSHYLWIVVVC